LTIPELEKIQLQYQTLEVTYAEDLYAFWNAYRDWFNTHVNNYELYLEDNWFETTTTIEYILRSLDTFNIVILAEDTYANEVVKGVWHLGAYQFTRLIVTNPLSEITLFIGQNTPLLLKEKGKEAPC
jgi:hypothetical protein